MQPDIDQQTQNNSQKLSDTHSRDQFVSAAAPVPDPFPLQTIKNRIPFLWPAIGIVLCTVFIVGGVWFFRFNKLRKQEAAAKKEQIKLESAKKQFQAFLNNHSGNQRKNDLSLSYKDSGTLEGSESDFGILLKDIQTKIQSKGYENTRNSDHQELNAALTYMFGSGNTTISSGLDIIVIGNDLFIKIGENPFLSSLLNGSSGKHYEWVKIDLKSLSEDNSIKTTSASEASPLELAPNLFSVTKVYPEEIIDSTPVQHLTLELNTSVLGKFLASTISSVAAQQGQSLQPEEISLLELFTTGFTKKIAVEHFDVWLDPIHSRLYKLQLKTNAPSVIHSLKNFNSSQVQGLVSLLNTTHSFSSKLAQLEGTQLRGMVLGQSTTSDDAKRLLDIEHLQQALKNYKEDTGGYPPSAEGAPVGLVPKYIAVIPKAPQPSGTCTDFFNNYWYKTSGRSKTIAGKPVFSSYQYTFCLGSDIATFKAGVGIATPDGVETTTNCSNLRVDQCLLPKARPEKDPKTEITQLLDSITFSAVLELNADFSSYDKNEPLQPPEEFYDLTPEIKKLKTPCGQQSCINT